MKNKEFKVNEYITIKLEKGESCPIANIFVKERGGHKSHLYHQEFEEFCQQVDTWVKNDYSSRFLSDDNVEVFYSLLHHLRSEGEPVARKYFKKILTDTIKNAEFVDYSSQFLISQGCLSDLSTQELVRGILEPEEAKSLLKIIKESKKMDYTYHLAIDYDNDELRRRTHSERCYYITHKGHVVEMDLHIEKASSKLLKSIFSFKKLETLHLFLHGFDEHAFTTDKKLESLKSIYLYREVSSNSEGEEMKLPPFQDYFPNLTGTITIGYEIFLIKGKTQDLKMFEFVPSKFRYCPEKIEKLKKDLNMS